MMVYVLYIVVRCCGNMWISLLIWRVIYAMYMYVCIYIYMHVRTRIYLVIFYAFHVLPLVYLFRCVYLFRLLRLGPCASSILDFMFRFIILFAVCLYV